ncbi:MAG TPA: hypothetical protein VFR01_05845, partial [Geobacterales bacterium]|nr:hypothetical protein [Geobacterales bacterium]
TRWVAPNSSTTPCPLLIKEGMLLWWMTCRFPDGGPTACANGRRASTAKRQRADAVRPYMQATDRGERHGSS